ncbi:MAG: tetraacyldisaccharide 4'-kinase [Alphaproteobacteria bacterium]
MRSPGFWSDKPGVVAALLSPIAALYAATTARRMTRAGQRLPLPVICCGNATAGGAGKTTVALDLGERLKTRGLAAHFLLRGYGGKLKGPARVDPISHDSRMVGDEALLLAALGPTWVSANRAAGGAAAQAAGAQAIIMDDGLQNPTLEKSLSLLIIDGSYGFGNGRVIPSGPLREPVAAAAARCQAAVLIGADETNALDQLPPGLPVLRARLVPGPEAAALAGKPVVAFCGIANPRKFFATLQEAGAVLAARHPFADHYPFDDQEIRAILAEAEKLRATPVTTRKDIVRIPAALRAGIQVVSIALAWDDPAEIEALLDKALAPRT